MAMESACKLRVGKDNYAGKVRMEADYIDFSGSTKFRFRLTEATHAHREEDTIVFNFHGHPVHIVIGDVKRAEAWMDYIALPRTLADKLGVKEGCHVRVLNLDDSELLSSLETKKTKMVKDPFARCDMVMLGVERPSELQKIEDLSENLNPNGAIWVVLPKSIRTVTKANVIAAVREAGLNHAGTVDYSETQHAHKIVRRPQYATKGGNGTATVTSGK
ncbi:MAG TPA: DUF3052 family protein [Phycisphaerae bacterium]|nr:DUF3052 family protein [Phycisphaerae bacterium]